VAQCDVSYEERCWSETAENMHLSALPPTPSDRRGVCSGYCGYGVARRKAMRGLFKKVKEAGLYEADYTGDAR
jgi:hypothetical protein